MLLYFCCDEHRRQATIDSNLNGIDYLEVLDQEAPVVNGKKLRQQVLVVHLLKPLTVVVKKEDFQIWGGDRIRNIQVAEIQSTPNAPNDPNSKIIQVQVNHWGDFSTYTLKIVQSQPIWLDPVLSAVNFSFKVECPSEFDCRTPRVCPPEPQPQPEINYLARDYASFRQLMLDRMAFLIPQWQERNLADVGVMLVELLAYVGDYLSYQQEAITTEAYLGTARLRTSIRRHARLVDYFMHDGCNARVWIQIQVNAESVILKKQDNNIPTRFLTQCLNKTVIPNDQLQQVLSTYQPQVFEPLYDIVLYQANNELFFYSWGDNLCCLPKGATRATLKDNPAQRLRLCVGDVLIFEEKLGAKTGLEVDADPAHRHVVRLTKVSPEAQVQLDPQGNVEVNRSPGIPMSDPITNQLIVEIEWDAKDALPFPLCISAKTDSEHGEEIKQNISIALGNIVLADHGLTIKDEPIRDGLNDRVPPITLFKIPAPAIHPLPQSRCDSVNPLPIYPHFRPSLPSSPLTRYFPYKKTSSAMAAMQTSVQDAQPAVNLQSTLNTEVINWSPQPDLLESRANESVFVVETETDGTTYLRFGDNQYGMRPEAGMQFTATYRVGNGLVGNVGADKIVHLISGSPSITASGIIAIRNPLPAQGGVEMELNEEVRQRAPIAFRTQERAVTPKDYADTTGCYPGVRQAAATFRWTGSWRTVFLEVDRLGGLEVDTDFKTQIRQYLERYRLAGHDLEVEAPILVSLEIEMQVCVKPDYFRSDVKAALLEVFSNRILPDGRRGIFYPDNFTFGQPVYLSPIYAAAQAVDGVASLLVTTFQRQGTHSNTALKAGKLELSRLEIARLDNDPNFPDRGVLRLNMQGGK